MVTFKAALKTFTTALLTLVVLEEVSLGTGDAVVVGVFALLAVWMALQALVVLEVETWQTC